MLVDAIGLDLPDYPYADYAYTLGMQCFCATFDQRYRITVAPGYTMPVQQAPISKPRAC